jgi:hypothetical protein
MTYTIVISNVKKAINGKVKSGEMPLMNPQCENMF